MYARNKRQARRKQDYLRYEKLTEKGYSISDEMSPTSLYTVGEDPFGRAYYTKPLGASIKRDPLTGRKYEQEEWATKDFVVDNKTQLINKTSADLVVGKEITIEPSNPDEVPEIDKEWLEDFKEKNKLSTMLYEGAIQNSSKGDHFFEVVIGDSGEVEVVEIDPYFVDIEHRFKKVQFYEIAYEFDVEKPRKFLRFGSSQTKKTTYVQKKIHYPGKIVYALCEQDDSDYVPVPLNINPDNDDLLEKATTAKHMKMFIDLDKEIETENVDEAYFIVEYTGIDVPLLIHWPNYRMFDIFGVSDTGMIESLQNALNNRETQINDVLDKHADPSMYGPEEYLDENGNIQMTGGGARYFPVTQGMEPPSYLTWTGHLAEAAEEIKRIYKAMLDNTEVSSALTGDDSGGVESGRALMYKLIRSLCMAARKSIYLKAAVSEMIKTAQKMRQVWIDGKGVEDAVNYTVPDFKETVFDITISVKSSLPTDRTATIEDVVKMIDAKILSVDTAVKIVSKLFDEIDEEDEIEKLLEAGREALNRAKELNQSQIPDYLKSEPRTGANQDNNKGDQVITDDTKVEPKTE